jgi:hypothetical protein
MQVESEHFKNICIFYQTTKRKFITYKLQAPMNERLNNLVVGFSFTSVKINLF